MITIKIVGNPWLILSSQHLRTSESQKLLSTLCAFVPFSPLIPHSSFAPLGASPIT